jgi:hypothetical protein
MAGNLWTEGVIQASDASVFLQPQLNIYLGRNQRCISQRMF